MFFTAIGHQPGEDQQGETRVQFLAHAVEVFGMEVFDLEHRLALFVHLFDRPALVVEVGKFLRGVDLAIRQRGHEHPIAIGALDQTHRSLGVLVVSGEHDLLVGVGATDECRDLRVGGKPLRPLRIVLVPD